METLFSETLQNTSKPVTLNKHDMGKVQLNQHVATKPFKVFVTRGAIYYQRILKYLIRNFTHILVVRKFYFIFFI